MTKSAIEVVSNQQRLTKYSTSIAKCASQSLAYAKCVVANSENLKKDACVSEFNLFKDCVKNVRV